MKIEVQQRVEGMSLRMIIPIGMNIPSGYVKIAIENGHRNSGFTH